MGLAEVLQEELPAPAVRLREGVDFVAAEEAARLLAARSTVETIALRVPGWALMVMATLRELRLLEATGQLPGGVAYSRQPAWKVELWESWWDGGMVGWRDGGMAGLSDGGMAR